MSSALKVETSSVPMKWELKTVDEIKSLEKKSIISGPFGSNISAKYFVPIGVPVVRGNNLSLELGTKFKDNGFVFVSQQKAEELGTWAEKDDIIFTAVGTIGQVGILTGKEKYQRYIISNKQLRLRVNKSIVEPLFAYYWFASPEMVDTITQRNTGSSVPLINLSVLKSLTISLPNVIIQKQIVHILTSLDDKIDLLHRQNKTLEQMAETLFRQWFVEEADESWEIKQVKDVCLTITKGTTPTTFGKPFTDFGINFIKAESLTDVGGFIPEKFAFIDSETDQMLQRSRIQEGDILITIAGTIGRIGYVTDKILPANTNQAIGIMRPNKEIISPYFLYCMFKSAAVKNDFEGRIVHAVQPNLSLGEIGDIEFQLPPKDVLNSGMKSINVVFQKKEINISKINNLTRMRDMLLPKLMCGEISVN